MRKYVDKKHPIRTDGDAESRKPALFDCIWGAIERERKRRDWGLVDNELTKSTNERYQKILDMEIDILNALVELETAERTTCRRRYVLENEIFPKRGRLFKMQAELLDEFGS